MYKYFTLDEFKCPCCNANKIDPFLVEKLDVARSLANMPFVINSGYRCSTHNKAVGGVANSSHILGKAVDIDTPDMLSRFLLVSTLLDVGFSRIEIAPTWTHVDIDKSKPIGMFLS